MDEERMIMLERTCVELLDTLIVTLFEVKKYVEENNIPIGHKHNISCLLGRTKALLAELDEVRFRTPDKSTEPTTRRKFTDPEPDEEFTVPDKGIHKSGEWAKDSESAIKSNPTAFTSPRQRDPRGLLLRIVQM